MLLLCCSSNIETLLFCQSFIPSSNTYILQSRCSLNVPDMARVGVFSPTHSHPWLGWDEIIVTFPISFSSYAEVLWLWFTLWSLPWKARSNWQWVSLGKHGIITSVVERDRRECPAKPFNPTASLEINLVDSKCNDDPRQCGWWKLGKEVENRPNLLTERVRWEYWL